MLAKKIDLSRFLPAVESARPIKLHGKVTQVVGLVIEGFCPETAVGTLCEINSQGSESIPAEVVGFRENKTLLMPSGNCEAWVLAVSSRCAAKKPPWGSDRLSWAGSSTGSGHPSTTAARLSPVKNIPSTPLR